MDTENLPPRGQSVEFYLNKWIFGVIRSRNELQNPNQNTKLKIDICIITICQINLITLLTPMETETLPP